MVFSGQRAIDIFKQGHKNMKTSDVHIDITSIDICITCDRHRYDVRLGCSLGLGCQRLGDAAASGRALDDVASYDETARSSASCCTATEKA